MDITTIFINNLSITKRGEFNVIIFIISKFTCLVGIEIVNKQVHDTITVRSKIDFIIQPHRKNILSQILKQSFTFFGLIIINPDIISHATFIIFPGSELSEHPVKSQLIPIG